MSVLQQNLHQQEKNEVLFSARKWIPAKLDEDTPLRLDVNIDDFKILGVVIDSQMN